MRKKQVQVYNAKPGNGNGPVEIHINNNRRSNGGAATTQVTTTTPNQPNNSFAHANSTFDGGLLGLIGISILMYLIILFTLCIGTTWAICLRERWYAKHTRIEGKQLGFDGTGLQLLGKFIVWIFLTLVTLGIYSLWLSLRMREWIVSHTYFEN